MRNSPSIVHDQLATLQRYHQERVTRYHPRNSIVALQSRTTKGGEVMCWSLVVDHVDRVVDDEAGATRTRWGSLMDH